MSGIVRECAECGGEQVFEPYHGGDCPDSPDGCCPEWWCTGCGTALLAGFAPRLATTAGHSPEAGGRLFMRGPFLQGKVA